MLYPVELWVLRIPTLLHVLHITRISVTAVSATELILRNVDQGWWSVRVCCIFNWRRAAQL